MLLVPLFDMTFLRGAAAGASNRRHMFPVQYELDMLWRAPHWPAPKRSARQPKHREGGSGAATVSCGRAGGVTA